MRDGIVVFDFLRAPVPEQIADRAIDRVVATVAELRQVHLELKESARAQLRSLATADIGNGGRGIVSAIETHLVNPLAWELFDRPRDRGSVLRVVAVEPAGQNSRLVLG
jgi:ATP-dependent Clp protease ATP-binding subunit ClpA